MHCVEVKYDREIAVDINKNTGVIACNSLSAARPHQYRNTVCLFQIVLWHDEYVLVNYEPFSQFARTN